VFVLTAGCNVPIFCSVALNGFFAEYVPEEFANLVFAAFIMVAWVLSFQLVPLTDKVPATVPGFDSVIVFSVLVTPDWRLPYMTEFPETKLIPHVFAVWANELVNEIVDKKKTAKTQPRTTIPLISKYWNEQKYLRIMREWIGDQVFSLIFLL